MKLTLIREYKSKKTEYDFEFLPQESTKHTHKHKRPMVLDVLLQAEFNAMPDLAYRYGCRNGLCGVCTVNVNGKPKLACRTKVRNGDKISAMSGLPVVRDLVVKRDAINQQLRGRMPVVERQSTEAGDERPYLSLNRCIECYACLEGCPLHEKNEGDAEAYHFGNPFSFLKLQQVHVNPCATEENKEKASEVAIDIGLESCVECDGCRCGVGIDLKTEVIEPFLKNAALIAPDDVWPTKNT